MVHVSATSGVRTEGASSSWPLSKELCAWTVIAQLHCSLMGGQGISQHTEHVSERMIILQKVTCSHA